MKDVANQDEVRAEDVMSGPDLEPQYEGPEGGQKIQKVTHVHRAMVDEILVNPKVTVRGLSQLSGFGEPWVRIILRSQVFKDLLEDRRSQLVDPIIIGKIEGKLARVAYKSLEVIERKISKNPDDIPDHLVVKVLEIASKGLGLGQPKTEQAPQEVGRLQDLAKRLIDLKPRNTDNGVIYEAEDVEISGNKNGAGKQNATEVPRP